MSAARRTAARLANAGIVLFGLAVLVVIGTGGTRIELGFGSLGLEGLWRPLQGLGLSAALRVLVSRRNSGLEGRIAAFFARQGLAPRHLPATPVRALRVGALLGGAFGFAVGAADATRVAVAAGRPGLPLPDLTALGLVAMVIGPAVGIIFGAAVALLLHVLASAITDARPGRYELGRWTLAVLLCAAPALVLIAPDAGGATPRSAVLMATAVVFLSATILAGLVLPTIILRALEGSWGLAIGGGGLLALVLGLVAVGWLGASPSGGAGGDSSYPNVLLVTVSGLRADALGSYGGIGELTPELDRLAQRGARLADAITPSTALAAADASLLTGQYPWAHRLRSADEALELTGVGLPALLSSHGYASAAFVSARRLDGSRTRFAEMFDPYDDPTTLEDLVARLVFARVAGLGRTAPVDSIRSGRETIAEFRSWLATAAAAPWFVWIELAEPLRPEPTDRGVIDLARTPWAGLAVRDAPLASPPTWADREQRKASERAWIAGYVEAVREADAAVGELMALLAARGELARTVVLVTSERGTPLGGGVSLADVSRNLAREVIHVPLIVGGPTVEPGAVVEGPASLVDVLPTLAGLIRIDPGRPVEGEDLSRYLLAGEAAERAPHAGPVFCETAAPDGQPRAWAVRLGPWKLVEQVGGEQGLFVVSAAGELPLREIRGRNERLRDELVDLLTRQRARSGR